MYQIITDSAWDYTPEQAKELGVQVVPFRLTLDGENYLADGVDISPKELYKFMIANPKVFPKSSQPSYEDYRTRFETCAREGKGIICFTLSGKLTGSCRSAAMAKDSVLEVYPDAKIEVIDTELATVLQGLAIEQIARLQQQGASFEHAVAEAKRILPTGRIFFTIENLDYLIAGGRIGKVVGRGANMLNVRPMILLREGELFSKGIARGREKSIQAAISNAMDYIRSEKIDPDKYAFIVGYGPDKSEGKDIQKRFIKELKTLFPSREIEIPISQIGSLIAAYTGPHPIGIGLIEKAKME